MIYNIQKIGSIKQIGFQVPERLRAQYDRTVTSKGCNKSNGLGFRATERFRVSGDRTTQARGFEQSNDLTIINKDLTEKIWMMQTMFVHLYNKQLKIKIMKTYYLNRVNYSVIGTKKELKLFTELLGKCMNGRPATMSDEVVSELILSEKVTEKLNSVGFALEYTRLVKLNN